MKEKISKEEYKQSWFTFDDSWNVIEVKEESIKDLDNSCYFCGFNELKAEQHHIIRKCDGGSDLPSNRLPLCPNHHFLIHRRIYVLGYNPKKCFYFLIHRKNRKVIYPTKEQMKNKRKFPYSSIKYSKRLEIKGDLKTKGVVCVRDFHRGIHNHFKKRSVKVSN